MPNAQQSQTLSGIRFGESKVPTHHTEQTRGGEQNKISQCIARQKREGRMRGAPIIKRFWVLKRFASAEKSSRLNATEATTRHAGTESVSSGQIDDKWSRYGVD